MLLAVHEYLSSTLVPRFGTISMKIVLEALSKFTDHYLVRSPKNTVQ